MKRLLTAFTLAEVLVTLGIIGVVARVTLPALMNNTQKQQAAASLMKAINTLELANATILSENYSTSLINVLDPSKTASTTLNTDKYLDFIADYVKGTLRTQTVEVNGSSTKNKTTLTTKDGIMLFMHNTSLLKLGSPDTPLYSGTVFQLTVDINGTTKPNRVGEDQFRLFIDDYGSIIAPGSKEHAAVQATDFKTASKNGNDSPWARSETGCNATACSKNKPGEGTEYAAGSILENGGKIIYKITD